MRDSMFLLSPAPSMIVQFSFETWIFFARPRSLIVAF